MTINERIRQVLKFAHKGSEIKSVKIRSMTLPISDKELRTAISEMVVNEVCPIGSNSKGFYICEKEEEFDAAIGYIKSRIAPLAKRARALERMKQCKQDEIRGKKVLEQMKFIA